MPISFQTRNYSSHHFSRPPSSRFFLSPYSVFSLPPDPFHIHNLSVIIRSNHLNAPIERFHDGMSCERVAFTSINCSECIKRARFRKTSSRPILGLGSVIVCLLSIGWPGQASKCNAQHKFAKSENLQLPRKRNFCCKTFIWLAERWD